MPERRLLLTADAVGGVWNYCVELVRGLRATGWRVALAVLGPRASGEQREQLAGLRHVQLFEHTGALEWMDEPWHDVQLAGEFLQRLARRFRPRLVHLNGYCHGQLDFGAPKLVVAHSCVLSWWEAVEATPTPGRLEPYRAAVRRGLRGADLVVAPTQHMLRSLCRYYGPLSEALVIENGRTPAAVAAAKEPLVLCAARVWDRGKNVAALARAASHLSWPVYVAGEGDLGATAARQLGSLSPAELGAWYARASIYALPARYEPFGLSVLEAAQAGCALVLGDIPSLRELWGEAAVYVQPGDDAALERQLELLIGDVERRQRLGREATRRALHLNGARMTRNYLKAYEALGARRSVSRSCEIA